MALISLIVAIYYNVVMAYTLYYFFASMQTNLPWTTCSEVSLFSFYLKYIFAQCFVRYEIVSEMYLYLFALCNCM